ncbi:cytochrome P450 oxidoreductase [Colletotrichum scovillei]|uniref:Cytochrome P450 oxidoreductase n=1 Tax=Colletotrichum scovillei TaxID=1209932 RepID=A0A9P7QR87_9PEZI|nr:cytochrome P450 oxidoreductase [Colletotrichum scovillei]KAG7041117.1 cytochrome P450 oxidoreductase [Colletotrichum scovillei]
MDRSNSAFTLTSWIYVLLLLLVILIWASVDVITETFSSLRKLPGPFEARFSRLWYFRHVRNGNFHHRNIQLHEKYVRIAPKQYSINDPAVIKTIYGIGKGFLKSAWYEASSPVGLPWQDLFTDRDGARHAANRRLVANLYSVTSLRAMESDVEDCLKVFVKRLGDLGQTQDPIDLQFWMQCYAFDVVSQITLGQRFGCLDTGSDRLGIFASQHVYLKYCAMVGIEHELHGTLDWILSKLPPGQLMNGVNFTAEQLKKGRARFDMEKGSPDRQDFMSKLFRLHHENPDKFPESAVFTTCMINIGAGSDTTSISLCAVIYDLASHPVVLQRLREDIDAKFAELDNPEFIPFKDAQAMSFLQACIKESLRLHPATGLPLARVVPKGGVNLLGRDFNEGCVVGVNTWVLHRNKDVFGADADDYRPDRWFSQDKEHISLMESNWIPFGVGSRTCIGKNISLLEINKLVPILVKTFDFTPVEPERIRHENYWLVKQVDMLCKVSPRST